MFREFQVFVKPVGARCNLNCNYCYYLEKDFQGAGEGPGVMSPELLERYITGHLEASSDQSIIFSWHGGEPTLAGIDFYRKALEIQKKYQIPGTKIVNGIQTNGTLLHMEWCKFLKEEGFAVGISLDGPRVFHDRFRTGKNRHSTFDRVLQGYTLLKKYEVPTEVLCVVNAVNVAEPLEIYRFFKELGVKYLTFLPLVERKQGSFSEVTERSVPSLDFGAFLSAIFDEWVEQDIGAIKIQVFEEATRSAFRQEHTLCIFKKRCGGVPVVEHNGDFYSCDHYVDPQYRLGNISRQSLVELLEHPRQLAFGDAKEISLPGFCRECEVLDMCNGECPKNRFITTPAGEAGLNYLCEGYKLFFNHCRPFVNAVAAQWG